MTDTTVTLLLQAENRGLLPPVKQSQAAVKELGQASTQAGRIGADGIRKIGQEASSVERDVQRLSSSARAAAGSIVALASVRMAQQLGGSFLQAADRAGQLEARVRQASGSQKEFDATMARSQQIARSSYQSINSVAEIAIQSAGPMRQLGYSMRDTLNLTEALSLSLVASAANQQRSAATIDQFSKAMQTGTLRGQEFQTVLQNAPRFATALEDALGKTRAELIAMANDGQLTISQLTKVAGQLSLLREEVDEMPTTLEDAMVRFGDAWQKFAGDANKSIQINGALVGVVDALSDNLGNLALAAGVVAVAIGGRLVTSIGAATAAKVKDIVQSRAVAQAELVAARAAQTAAEQRMAMARAGMGTSRGWVAAEAELAAAQARTAAATRAASIAMVAKAAATRAASMAMAAFGGPVGLAVTALTMFVLWARNSSKEAEELSRSVRDGFQGAMQDLRAFNAETANVGFSGLAQAKETVESARREVELLAKQEAELSKERTLFMARFGYESAHLRSRLEDKNRELDIARNRYGQLNAAQQSAINVSADLVLAQAGVTSATKEQRQALEDQLKRLADTGMTLQENLPTLVKWAREVLGMEAANRLAAASLDSIGNAADTAASSVRELTEAAAENIKRMSIQRAGIEGGTEAEIRRRYGYEIVEKGLLGNKAALKELGQAMLAEIDATKKLEAARKSAAEGTRAESAANRDYARDLKQQAESRKRYTSLAAIAVAELEGPMRAAEQARIQRVSELDAELKALNITQEAYNVLVGAAHAEESRRLAELETKKGAPQALLDTMTGELRMLGMLGEERERYSRRLQNEADMRRAIDEANEAGAGIDAARTAELIAQARAYADLSMQVERNAALQEAWAGVALDGVSALADSMADLWTSQRDGARSFIDDLKNIFKRGLRDIARMWLEQNFVQPMQDSIMSALSGQGFGGAGKTLSQIFSGGGMGGDTGNLFSRIAGLFGGSAASGATASAQRMVGSVATGTLSGVPANIGQIAAQTAMPGWMRGMNWTGAITGGMLGLAGGSGGVSRLASGLTGAVAGNALGGALSAALVAGKAGTSIAGSLTAGLKSIGTTGWIALGAFALDKLTGGGLFGTSWKTTGGASVLNISDAGASGYGETEQSRKRSLFRGTKRRTITSELDADAISAASDLYDQLQSAVSTAADALRVQAPRLIAGSFRQTFDASGNMTGQQSTVLGRSYNEDQEAFAARLSAENLLAVAKLVNNSAAEIESISNRYRHDAHALSEIAAFMGAVQEDVANNTQLWADTSAGSLTRVTERFEALSRAGESLVETYGRVTTAARDYGSFVAGIETEIRTAGLNQYQRAALEVETQYREQVRTANELARALGLSGARAEDLASIEQLRAINMASVQRQLEAERDAIRNDLTLSQYSPLTDRQKLGESMSQLTAAVAAGDVQRARSLSETALGLGRNLYASGQDYNSLFAEVNSMLDGLGSGLDLDMDDGTTMGDLADVLLELPDRIAAALFERAWNPNGALPDAPPVTAPGTNDGSIGSNTEDSARLANIEALLQQIARQGGESLSRQVEAELQR